MALPRFVLIKSYSCDKFLQYVKPGTKGEGITDTQSPNGLVQFTCNDIMNPYNQFEFEQAPEKCDEGLILIRSCYNNKYFTRRSDKDDLIVATAEKPKEDDTASLECMLFKPEVKEVDDTKNSTVLFLYHVQLKRYTRCMESSGHIDCLVADAETPDTYLSRFTIIDVESLVMLPKKVAFKGNNSKYLCNTNGYLQFCADDIGNSHVLNEAVFNKDGSVCIKSTDDGRWWVQGTDSKFSASGDSPSLQNSFWPVKIDYNVIAFRIMSSNSFLQKCVIDGKDYLCASPETIIKDSFLTVEEPIISRKIYNIRFNTSDARIYNQKPTVMATGSVVNHTKADDTIKMTLSHTESKSNRWDASGSLKIGRKVSMESKIPECFVQGKVELSAEISYEHQWGDNKVEVKTHSTEVDVPVESGSKKKVSVMAITATYDVPFTYDQRDTDLSGNPEIQTFDDGIYRGGNCYDFSTEIKNDESSPPKI